MVIIKIKGNFKRIKIENKREGKKDKKI